MAILRMVLVGVVLVAGPGCSGAGGGGGAADVGDPALRRELLEMQAADQAERASEPPEGWDDAARTERLAEIIDEHGWPTRELVGSDGATAAWVIAQHSDLDLAFQERALELLTEAVAEDDASPGDLAYLSDRVAVAKGEPQTYGTQIRCDKKKPVPPTPVADPAAVDELRAEAGLEPLQDYLDEMTEICEGV